MANSCWELTVHQELFQEFMYVLTNTAHCGEALLLSLFCISWEFAQSFRAGEDQRWDLKSGGQAVEATLLNRALWK